MRRFYDVISLLLVFYLLNASSGFAYHVNTHRLFNKHIVENNVNGFSLDSYLKDELALSRGVEEEFQSREGECKLQETNRVLKWIEKGGSWEDNPPPDFPDSGFISCPWAIRAFNHYYNPVDNKGLSSWGGNPVTEWFLYQQQRTIFWEDMGNYSWDDVRGYFYNALTSADKSARDDGFADTFRGLGHLMHLTEDVSVPSHARLDPHIFYHYEDWVEHHYVREDPVTGEVSEKNPLPAPDPFYHFFGSPVEEDNTAIENILCIIDHDTYNGENHEDLTLGEKVGLSEYANANFFSNDTIRHNDWWSRWWTDFEFPRITDNVREGDRTDPRDPGGKVITKYYLWNDNYEDEDYRLATVPFVTAYIQDIGDSGMERKRFPSILDDYVYEDYAARLVPRAIAYASEVPKYFFRGKIDMFPEEIGSGYVIENKSEEDMFGDFELYYDNTDGERQAVRNRSGRAVRWNLSIPAGGSEHVEADFDTPDDIGSAEEYVLVFRGELGNERDAVAARIPVTRLKDYLYIRVGGGNLTNYVVVWDLAAGRPANHIRDRYGNLVSFPCEESRISGWYGKRKQHKNTEDIWSEGESVNELRTVAYGIPVKPEGWNEVDAPFEVKNGTGEFGMSDPSQIIGGDVSVCCNNGCISHRNSNCTGTMTLKGDLGKEWEVEDSGTSVTCGGLQEFHTWGEPLLQLKRTRTGTYSIEQEVTLKKSYGVIPHGITFGSGTRDIYTVLNEDSTPHVEYTKKEWTIDDDTVPDYWGSDILISENGSGVNSFIKTSYTRSETKESYTHSDWDAKNTGAEECFVVDLANPEDENYKKFKGGLSGGTEKGSDTYTFHTHFGQLGDPVELDFHFTKAEETVGHEFQITPAVRQIVTLSSGRALAQIFLYHFSVSRLNRPSFKRDYEERRTYVHAQAALTDGDGREADPTKYERDTALEEKITEAVDAFYDELYRLVYEDEASLDPDQTFSDLETEIKFLH